MARKRRAEPATTGVGFVEGLRVYPYNIGIGSPGLLKGQLWKNKIFEKKKIFFFGQKKKIFLSLPPRGPSFQ